MVKPVGGRAKQALYETTHVRVPVPIKPYVEAVIKRFHAVLDPNAVEENSLTNLQDAINSAKGVDLEEATAIAKEILKQKKSARVSIEKLLTVIYGKNVEL